MINANLLRRIRDEAIDPDSYYDTLRPLELSSSDNGCLASAAYEAKLINQSFAEQLQYAKGCKFFNITEKEWRAVLHPLYDSTRVRGRDFIKAINELLTKYGQPI